MLTQKIVHNEEAKLRELDQKFEDEKQRWNRFFQNLNVDHPLATNFPDEHLVEWIRAQKNPSGRALDLGCGNGRNAIYLAQNGFQVEVNDISESALALVKASARATGTTVECILGPFFELDITPGSYDLIYDLGCLHHVHPHRRRQYIDFVTDNLRVGGHFILGCFNEKMGTTKSDEDLLKTFDMEGGISMSKERILGYFGESFELLKFRSMRALKEMTQGVGWEHISISIWQKK